jgi:hypothetical protein
MPDTRATVSASAQAPSTPSRHQHSCHLRHGAWYCTFAHATSTSLGALFSASLISLPSCRLSTLGKSEGLLWSQSTFQLQLQYYTGTVLANILACQRKWQHLAINAWKKDRYVAHARLGRDAGHASAYTVYERAEIERMRETATRTRTRTSWASSSDPSFRNFLPTNANDKSSNTTTTRSAKHTTRQAVAHAPTTNRQQQ